MPDPNETTTAGAEETAGEQQEPDQKYTAAQHAKLRKEALAAAKAVDITTDDLEQHSHYKFGSSFDALKPAQLEETRDLFLQAKKGRADSGGSTSERASGPSYRKDFTDVRDVRRPFTEDEIADKKNSLVEALNEKEELEQKRHNFLQESTGEINEAKDRITKLHHEIRDGFQRGERKVRIHRDFDRGLRVLYDVQTDQFLGTEALKAADYQLDAIEDIEENERREAEAALSDSSDTPVLNEAEGETAEAA